MQQKGVRRLFLLKKRLVLVPVTTESTSTFLTRSARKKRVVAGSESLFLPHTPRGEVGV